MMLGVQCGKTTCLAAHAAKKQSAHVPAAQQPGHSRLKEAQTGTCDSHELNSCRAQCTLQHEAGRAGVTVPTPTVGAVSMVINIRCAHKGSTCAGAAAA